MKPIDFETDDPIRQAFKAKTRLEGNRIYVAGPYTTPNPRRAQLNVNKAIEVGCQLMHRGWHPYIPHLLHYVWLHPDGDFDYDNWIQVDLDWLKVSNAFFYIDSSKGADIELEFAKELDIPIYTKIEDVPWRTQ